MTAAARIGGPVAETRRDAARAAAAIGLYAQLTMHVLNPDSDAAERAATR
ncbi:MAG: hypothetical protein JO262_20845 [Solirubrobacterales bacterium]|nr:hypothetical protein [Solirubrobacterales bacterium]MBV9944585.1 hypothetical protein [Solirubrobacterales bacterium]